MANRIIFLTGDVATEETLQFVQSTGNPHLGKPFHLANLEDVVVNALAETATKPGPDLVTGK